MAEITAKNRANWQKTHQQNHQNRVGTRFEEFYSRSARQPLRTTTNGRQNIHFILANNLLIENSAQKLNAYIPCIAWGNIAQEIAKLQVNDKITIEGELHSREYVKVLPNGENEIRVAHELLVLSFNKV